MKVWFGCTTKEWAQYRIEYFAIRKELKEMGCVVLFDWIDRVDQMFSLHKEHRDIAAIYEQVVSAIDEADIVVIEYTVPNFSSSHQINYALLKKKPTLVMRLEKDNPRFRDSYLEALLSPYLTLKQYTPKTRREILAEFVGYSQLDPGQQRYNIVLDKKQKHFLDWAAVIYKKSRSLIIRELITAAIEKDKEYQKYMKRS